MTLLARQVEADCGALETHPVISMGRLVAFTNDIFTIKRRRPRQEATHHPCRSGTKSRSTFASSSSFGLSL